MPHEATDRELAEFALANLDACPIAKRAALCRRLARLLLDSELSTALLAQAETLEEIAADHGQLLLRIGGGR